LAPSDFADPSARGLLLRLVELLDSVGATEWRPDILAGIDDPWLQAPVDRVRALLPTVGRLSDAQVAAATQTMRRQLHDTRLAVELRENSLALEDAEPEDRERIKARIAENSRQRAALQRAIVASGTALGQRLPVIPARFRES
jgi:hypothetical protein